MADSYQLEFEMKKRSHRPDSQLIKEAMDNLPAGLCVFDHRGFLVLSNHQMIRLFYMLNKKNLQYMAELENKLEENSLPDEPGLCRMPDGSIWRFEKTQLEVDNRTLVQFTAMDTSALYAAGQDLKKGYEELALQARRLERLSRNVLATAQEEEVLNMKMYIHDNLGQALLRMKQILKEGRTVQPEDLQFWRQTMNLLDRQEQLETDSDSLEQLVKWAQMMGLTIHISGSLPLLKADYQLLMNAMRECAVNAMRHGKAENLWVTIADQDPDRLVITLRNDGQPAKEDIQEKGGLASLRYKAEQQGAWMTIVPEPVFCVQFILFKDEVKE